MNGSNIIVSMLKPVDMVTEKALNTFYSLSMVWYTLGVVNVKDDQPQHTVGC